MAVSQDIHEYYMEEGSNQAHASAVINDKSKAWIVAVLVAINVVATVAMYHQWSKAETEVRMLEYYLLELDAKFIAGGLKSPSDSIAGKLRKEK
jgi:predicted Co/Zn/Cd cation transporter (cation efflux family)